MSLLFRLGWLLTAAAILLLVHEGYNAVLEDGYRLIPLGEIWFVLDRMLGTGTLNLTQAVVQRYLWPWIWEDGIQQLLLFPAWAVFLVPGVVLAVIGAAGRRRRRGR